MILSPEKKGFTLVELVVALAVLGLVFAVSVARFDRMFTGTRLEAAARGLGDHFAYGISRAYTTGRYHTLEFDLGAGKYWIKPGREDEEGVKILEESLGSGVRFTDIQAGGETYTPPGVLSVEISPLGFTGDLLVNLEDEAGNTMAVELDSLVQGIRYRRGYETWDEFQNGPSQAQ
ncbi:MAG TPA: prepilin-type N-terminal cleavage/methylation domain-containing protein [Planctomycetes bacterium]|nr:prepilin-type N-terminal cleavage/methylation domain-containing protein [Planctomycetota bacterium]